MHQANAQLLLVQLGPVSPTGHGGWHRAHHANTNKYASCAMRTGNRVKYRSRDPCTERNLDGEWMHRMAQRNSVENVAQPSWLQRSVDNLLRSLHERIKSRRIF